MSFDSIFSLFYFIKLFIFCLFTENIPQPAPSNHSHEMIYFMIILLLSLILIIFVVLVVFRFNRNRRQGKSVWNDFETNRNAVALADEDGQTMLMMLQQPQAGRLHPVIPPPHQRTNGTATGGGRHLASLASNLQRQQFIQSNNLLRNGTATNTVGATAEKFQLISRLNSSNQNIVDHFVLRCQGEANNGSGSGVSTFSSNNNKYEEPIFTNASPFRASPQHKAPVVPPLPPSNGTSPPVCSNSPQNSTGTERSNTTVTISTNTTTGSGESSSLEEHVHLMPEEPDYAEPIIDNLEQPQTYSNYHSEMAREAAHRISKTRVYPQHNRHQQRLKIQDKDNDQQPDLTSLCGIHEKFIKLSMDIFKHGHFSLMPNLGVGIYLTPNMFNAYYVETVDLYLRYGVDTSTKHSTGGYCSLSPVVTVNFSKNVGELSRPFVLCFRHCMSLPTTSNNNCAVSLSRLEKNVVVLWQDVNSSAQSNEYDQNRNRLRQHLNAIASSSKSLDSGKEGRDNRWLEILRYGEENLNTTCYLENDDQYVYLVTNLVGKYVLCLKNTQNSSLAGRANVANSHHVFTSPLLSNRIETDFVKLVNFSLLIEQFSPTEHLLKVYMYDALPNSTINLFNELPSSGQFHLRLGDRESTALRLTSRGGSIFLELQSHKGTQLQRSQIKGMKRIEIPLGHLWNAGPNVLLHCSFIVRSSVVIDEVGDQNESRPESESEEEEEEEEMVETRRMMTVSGSDDDQHHYDENQNEAESMLPSSGSANKYDQRLNYEVKVWQSSKTTNDSSIKSSTPITNVVLLKRQTTTNFRRGRHPSTTIGKFYREESVRLFEDRDLAIRNRLISSLDTPRSDQLDWREFAKRCRLGHYMPYFASQSSPATQIFELWESRVLSQFVRDNANTNNSHHSPDKLRTGILEQYEHHSLNEAYGAISTTSNSSMALREHYYTRLVQLLHSFARADLVDLIVASHRD